MGDLKNISNDIKQIRTAEIVNTLTELEKAVKIENSKLPEVVFKTYFLNYFKNGEVFDANTPLYMKWIENSGSPFNEVDIVDDNGNVLFTTPPLIAKPDIMSDAILNTNFNKINTEYALRSARLTADAENFAYSKLNPLKDGVKSEMIDDYKNTWDDIFKRYTTQSKIQHSLPYFSNMLDDELEY